MCPVPSHYPLLLCVPGLLGLVHLKGLPVVIRLLEPQEVLWLLSSMHSDYISITFMSLPVGPELILEDCGLTSQLSVPLLSPFQGPYLSSLY